MKSIRHINIRAVITAGLLFAALFLSSQAPIPAMAFDKKLGQDVTGKNCERKDTSESSTFGKCESVCKDKEVTRDAENNRWVCNATKSVGTRPRGERAPISDKAQAQTDTPKPKQQPSAGSKTVKAKKYENK